MSVDRGSTANGDRTEVVSPSAVRVRPGSIAARVQAAIHEGTVDLPVLPEAAQRIRTIIDHDGGAREVVAVIAREPSLAAAVLRYSNSVAFAGLRETTDLHEAVMRLGYANVEKTVMAISAKGAFGSADKADAHLYRSLWQHSLATALTARRLTPRSFGLAAETSFLAGLLHDIGKVVVLKCASQLRRSDPARYGFDDAAMLEFIDLLHCGAGEQLCAAWKLPDEIRAVALRHHDERLRGADDMLIAVVHLANLMTRRAGISLKPDPQLALADTPGAVVLGFDEERLRAVLDELEGDFASMDELF